MASFDESIQFVKEVFPSNDSSDATSRRMGPGSSRFPSGRRWSLQQAVMTSHRSIDEASSEEQVGGTKAKGLP
ncbi:UNVERIFIED_CONTAM: hypothetical protein Sangu_2156100 [Sesamum angustifolium]|uniref:Uncharacterized protein n=1 Tax=Sesamum angustifolium TaxID=2727405 RepID=A0AAW2LEM3_9LAMI